MNRIGYDTHKADSGEKAVQLIRETSYDLVVLDMVMTGIDGAETFRQILEIHPAQKAIIMSGYAMSSRIKQVMKMGANIFVAKPVLIDSLASAVRKTLDGVPEPVHEKVREAVN